MTSRAKKGGGGRSGKRGGGDEGPKHPIQQGIEKLYAAGKTPRIRLDARRNDVVVPESVRERWQESLVIDLDPGYPLNLVYSDEGLQVDLAFQGLQSRCTFTWQSIYGLFDRASGQGVQIASHLPKAELPDSLRARTAGPPKLRAISGVKSEPAKTETMKPESGRAKPEEPAASTEASDELAKARRAKFRVIPGG